MNEDVIFRSGLAVVSLALALVRFYYGRLAVKAGGKISFKRAGKIRTAYTTLLVWALVFFLLSANWLIGLAWLGLGIVAATMVGEEEAVLIEEFGDAYRVYMGRTGRFWLRFR